MLGSGKVLLRLIKKYGSKIQVQPLRVYLKYRRFQIYFDIRNELELLELKDFVRFIKRHKLLRIGWEIAYMHA